MLELKLNNTYTIKEFKNKMYEGRVFKLEGTVLVFQILNNKKLRFWATGSGHAFNENELDLINKVMGILKGIN